MELQFVFGNPRKGKRKKSKKNKGGSKVAKRRKKKKKVVSKKTKKKAHKKAGKAKKVQRTKRRDSPKKENPMTKTIVVKDRATKKIVAKDPARYHYGRKSGVTVSTPKEIAYGRFQVAAAKEAARKTKNRKKKKKIKTLSKRLTKALKVAQEKRMSLLKDAKEKRASVRAPHHIVSTKTKYISQRRKPVKKRKKVKSKRNPIFGAPRMSMNKIEQQFSKATGHDLKEAGLLFGAGATLPVIEGLLDKGLSIVPVLKDIKPALGKFGPEVAGMSSSLVTILVAGAAHYAVDKTGKAKQLEPVLRALIAASVVKAGSSLSGTVAKALGMSGVIFHPGMSGINFTPMSGINFTPMSGAPQLGHAAPQMGYGADFGRGYDVSDYGGGDGYTESHKYSTADFGSYDGDEEPVLDQSSSMG